MQHYFFQTFIFPTKFITVVRYIEVEKHVSFSTQIKKKKKRLIYDLEFIITWKQSFQLCICRFMCPYEDSLVAD